MSSCSNFEKPNGVEYNICTSDISCVDVNLSCLPYNNGGLNEVLTNIDAEICSLQNITGQDIQSSSVLYDGIDIIGCIDLTSAVNINDVIQILSDKICDISGGNVYETDDIMLSSSLNYLCLSDVNTFNNLSDLLNKMIKTICGLVSTSTSTGGSNSSTATQPPMASTLRSAFSGFTGNINSSSQYRSFAVKGNQLTTSSSSLTAQISDSFNFVNGWLVDTSLTDLILQANSDNYIDLYDNGTFTVQSVNVGFTPPPPASNAMRMFKITTDGSGVVSYSDLYEIYGIIGDAIASNTIDTRHIVDGSITGNKLEDIITAGTIGVGLINVGYDSKGRITSVSDNVNITSLSTNETLVYDGAKWVNVPYLGLPSGSLNDTLYYNGTWLSSGFLKNTGSSVGVGLTKGVPTLGFTLGSGLTYGSQIKNVNNLSVSGLSTGALPANEYFYVVLASDGVGYSDISNEVSFVVDGVTTKSVKLTWDNVPFAKEYIVYRGLSSGNYTEYVNVNTSELVDNNSGWTSGSLPIINDITAYTFNYNDAINIGTRFGLGEINFSSIDNSISEHITISVSGLNFNSLNKAVSINNSSDNLSDNIGLYLSITGGNENYSLYSDFGKLYSKENIIQGSDLSDALLYLSSYLGYKGNIISNNTESTSALSVLNGLSGSLSSAKVIVGKYSSGVYDEYLSEFSYYSDLYNKSVTSGGTPVDFYRNKAVMRAGSKIDGFIFSIENTLARFDFEIGGKSKVVIDSNGSVGIGIDDTGSTPINGNSILELKSTTKGLMLPRLKTSEISSIPVSATDEGLIVFDKDLKKLSYFNGTSWINI